MIFINTDNHRTEIEEALSSVEGLQSVVQIQPIIELDDENLFVVIKNNEIFTPIPWDNAEPPILFKARPYHTNNLIAIVLAKLGYEQEALDFSKDEDLSNEIRCRAQLVNPEKALTVETTGNDYHALHNRAILNHYVSQFHNGVSPEVLYKEAITKGSSDEQKAFSAKHFALLFMDNGNYTEAERLLRYCQSLSLNERAKPFISMELINILMESLKSQHSREIVEELKSLIWQTIEHFESNAQYWAIASLYTHASEISQIEKSYAESLGYVTKAITIYQEQDFPEFLSAAYIRKGTLLYAWAQDGNPQFFQTAIDTYQEALKFFTRENHPYVYAEIHHNMAVIYAEIPGDTHKKAMWAAFSATSFKECLDFFNQKDFPYEFAMIANNYGNALLKYPAAKKGDNAEKAIYYYLQAMEVRTSGQYPVERAHTILNYLEACWRVHNINKTMERARYKDMLAKAKEVKALTTDPDLIQLAQEHLDQISGLGLAIMSD